jgi:hypothetical protein
MTLVPVLTIFCASAWASPASSAGGPSHAAASIAGGGPVRRSLSPREAKLDAQIRRLVAPESPTAAATTLVPVEGAWRRGDALHARRQRALLDRALTLFKHAEQAVHHSGLVATCGNAITSAIEDARGRAEGIGITLPR